MTILCIYLGYKKQTTKKEFKMLNYPTIYTTDCCGAYCENDTDICPTCQEHCEVVTETFEIAVD